MTIIDPWPHIASGEEEGRGRAVKHRCYHSYGCIASGRPLRRRHWQAVIEAYAQRQDGGATARAESDARARLFERVQTFDVYMIFFMYT